MTQANCRIPSSQCREGRRGIDSMGACLRRKSEGLPPILLSSRKSTGYFYHLALHTFELMTQMTGQQPIGITISYQYDPHKSLNSKANLCAMLL
jgi:hypothetical protein